jgi:hypothetical protein
MKSMVGVQWSDRLCPRCVGARVEDEKHVMFDCYWYYDIRARFIRLYHGTGGPNNPACMHRLMNHEKQSAVAHLVHMIDERHQEPLCDLMNDDFQDEIW